MKLDGERQSTNIEDARTTTLTLTWISKAAFDSNSTDTASDAGGFDETQNGLIIWRDGGTADWYNDYSHIWLEMPEGSTIKGPMGQSAVTLSVDQTRILRKILQSIARQARSDLQVTSDDGALQEVAIAMLRNAR